MTIGTMSALSATRNPTVDAVFIRAATALMTRATAAMNRAPRAAIVTSSVGALAVTSRVMARAPKAAGSGVAAIGTPGAVARAHIDRIRVGATIGSGTGSQGARP